MRFKDASPSEEVRIDLTSLIDVVFNLLLFFLLTTSFRQGQEAIRYDLPKAESGGAMESARHLEFVIDPGGVIFHEGQPLNDAELDGAARRWAVDPSRRGRPVIIRADKVAQHGRVVHLIDVLRRNGFTEMAIGVQTEK